MLFDECKGHTPGRRAVASSDWSCFEHAIAHEPARLCLADAEHLAGFGHRQARRFVGLGGADRSSGVGTIGGALVDLLLPRHAAKEELCGTRRKGAKGGEGPWHG